MMIDDTLQQLASSSEPKENLFWTNMAKRLVWTEFPSLIEEEHISTNDLKDWYSDGILNASFNCIDRHLEKRDEKVALIWQGDDPQDVLHLTYRQLHERVCRFANVLVQQGVKLGDRVAIHLPGVPEGVIAMLACARIGALHVVLFGGFSASAISDRLKDCGAVLVITANIGKRGAKRVPYKEIMDEALILSENNTKVRTVLVVPVTNDPISLQNGRDFDITSLLRESSPVCHPVLVNSTHPLFLLYTSGSTAKPKGVIHNTGGYLVWASYTHAVVFDHLENDVFWCTADLGWITGHTYGVYGPLLNGGTLLIFEGLPSSPAPGRWWEVIERHQVTALYTSPTALRSVRREGDECPAKYNLSSLRILSTVGEAISPDVWRWFYTVIGHSSCVVRDTWWQTETGGIMMAPLVRNDDMKPGAVMTALPGIEPVLLSTGGQVIQGEGEGVLCFSSSWPGQANGIWGDEGYFAKSYLAPYPGYYYTGDGARRDADGHYWITGRIDDVINVSGHRIGTAEIESVISEDYLPLEIAAIGVPHALKGECLVIFVVLQTASSKVTDLENYITRRIAIDIGRYAIPEAIHGVPALPKTRSGKILRRLLRKIVSRQTDNLGDLSSLSDPSLVPVLIEHVSQSVSKQSNIIIPKR